MTLNDLAPPPPPPPSPVNKLSLFRGLPVCRRSSLSGSGGRGLWRGEKAWSSINHSILSGYTSHTNITARPPSVFNCLMTTYKFFSPPRLFSPQRSTYGIASYVHISQRQIVWLRRCNSEKNCLLPALQNTGIGIH